MRPAILAILVAAWAAIPRAAAAGPTLACQQTEADAIEIDGMLDDWKGVAKARGGGTAPDASFDVSCLYDGTRVLLAIDVRDEHVQRQPKFNAMKPAGDDRVTVALSATPDSQLSLVLFPGVDKLAPRRLLAGKKPVDKAIAIEDTLQPRGFSIELAVPASRIAGWSKSTPSLSLAVTFDDADVPKLAATENTVSWSGQLALGNVSDLLAAFLTDARLAKAQVTLDTQADVDPSKPGRERVVAAADVLALLTDHYTYSKLPVARAADVVKVELIDLRGDGGKLALAHVRQRGQGKDAGVRDLLTLWTVYNGQWQQLWAVEIGKQEGDKRLTSAWTVEAAKSWKQAKGARRVLVVRAQPAIGWDEDNYGETPADDVEPIHVPWDDDRIGGVYWIDGNDQVQGAAIKRR